MGRPSFVRATASSVDGGGGGGTEWTTDRVRSEFVSYFESHPSLPHTFVPSSPCAPLNDPTLLFANAGMNQFKPVFLGDVDPASPLASLRRAANSQKCVRAGGKHNDLDDVGRDTYHHTFFEMLGSWSFGDYFKEEAIDMAWDLLTRVYGLDPERLYATYFAGNDQVAEDAEARDLWLKYLPPQRVIGCDAKDNFWEMGDTGPCGPCSEVHYDRVGDRDAASLVNADDPDVIEIWNLVFVQYDRAADGALAALPARHVDTGMGLERLVSVLQNERSNYDTDAFEDILDAIAARTSEPYRGRVGADDVGAVDTAYRAVADHARTLCFALADGAVPDNEGRGYVLRRILRRGARYARQVLGVRETGLLSALVPVVAERYGDAYPELRERMDEVVEIVAREERAFDSMLDRGIKYFNELVEEEDLREIAGDRAFFLYDTMGFPVDLTELMAEERGMTVDVAGFHEEMEEQRRRSREARNAAKSGGVERLVLSAEHTAWLGDRGVAPTNDAPKFEWDAPLEATVAAVFDPSIKGFAEGPVTVRPGDVVGVLLDATPFYAEAGGQEADAGTLSAGGAELAVADARAYAGHVLHTCETDAEVVLTPGSTTVVARVDYARRRRTAPNHTATHVLNAVLRDVLGDGVEQRGSSCDADRLRFDFSHPKALTIKQLRRVETGVRDVVAAGLEVTDKEMPLEDAKNLPGVRAVFGEVYPDPVRVVRVGEDVSAEFCGGTHSDNTAEAGTFVLAEETAVAAGVRRITGLTGPPAEASVREGERLSSLVADAEAAPSEDVLPGLRKAIDAAVVSAPLKADLRARVEASQKKLFAARKAALAGRVDKVLDEVRAVLADHDPSASSALVLDLPDLGADSKAAIRVINLVKAEAPDVAFLGVSEEERGSGGKLACFALVPESVQRARGLRADDWVRETLAVAGGRGGGKPGNAQGQAKTCDDVDAVVRKGKQYADDCRVAA